MQVVQTMSQERIAERMNSVGQIADVPVLQLQEASKSKSRSRLWSSSGDGGDREGVSASVSRARPGAHPRKLAEQIVDVPDARLRKDTVEVTTTVPHERTSERIIVDVPCAADHQEHR